MLIREIVMYSTEEAARILGLSQDHVRLLARTGVISAKKVGRDWVVLDLNYTRKRKPKVVRNEQIS
jgi:excisionase family DNA binding protein